MPSSPQAAPSVEGPDRRRVELPPEFLLEHAAQNGGRVVDDPEMSAYAALPRLPLVGLVEGRRGEEPVGTEVVPARGDAAVVAFGERRDPVEVGAVGLAVVRVAADGVTEQQVAAQDAVEFRLADGDVLGLARRDPGVQAPAKQSAWVSSWMLRPDAAKPKRPWMAWPNSWAMTAGTRNRP